MRPVCLRTQAAVAILFILAPVAGEPEDLAIALKGQDVGSHAVQEPAVVADDHGRATKVQQRLFQGTQGMHVQVIRRLVQQQQIGPRFKHLRQMDTVSFTSRQRPHFLLLIAARKVKAGHIST